jgi:signal transduction histidine kinase
MADLREPENDPELGALRRSRERLEQVARALSHDTRAPLRAASGYLQLLQRRARDDLAPEHAELLDFALSEVQRAQRMVDVLRDFARLDRHVVTEPVDLADTLHRARTRHARMLEAAGAVIDVGELPTVRADPTLLEQALRHLLDNAARFVDEGKTPHIDVRATRVDAGWRLDITDDGIGMRERDLPRAREVFARLHGATDFGGGEGIGLSFAAAIAHVLGGELSLSSTPGEGTTVSLTLPAAEDEA